MMQEMYQDGEIEPGEPVIRNTIKIKKKKSSLQFSPLTHISVETLLLEEGNVVQGAIAVDEFEHHHFGLAKLPSICIGEVCSVFQATPTVAPSNHPQQPSLSEGPRGYWHALSRSDDSLDP